MKLNPFSTSNSYEKQQGAIHDAINNPTELVNTVAASGASQTLPANTEATMHHVTLTSNAVAIALPAAAAGRRILVVLKQDGTGSRVPTLTGVKWAAGTAPTWSTAANKVDVVELVCVNGTDWVGRPFAIDAR